MDVRPWSPDDRAQCLAVFDSNVPHSFDIRERGNFESFLDDGPGQYLVLEHEDAVVGCGGWAPEADAGMFRLNWGMVKREMHRMGIGKFLLLYRLRELAKTGAERVRLSAPQNSAGFFQKQGFKVQSSENDRVEMIMKLNVCP
jgi:N-acetylglutamate synthase-like GNAT family acetyltransferase